MHALTKQFAKMGARVLTRNPRNEAEGLRLNVLRDGDGEYFDFLIGNETTVQVQDVSPERRHLLLSYRDDDGSHQFLCGHDERHWFVAAIPEKKVVSKIEAAMEALKPEEVSRRQDKLGVRRGRRNKRRNEAYVRQGEWFFVPADSFAQGKNHVHKNEPLTRNASSKPHMVEELIRFGGESVFISSRFQTGIGRAQHEKMMAEDDGYRKSNIRQMVKDPEVYVRGKIRHPDHKTILLTIWHRVFMNTEANARAMRNVAFLD